MADTLRVKPRPGVILAGIPAAGADVPADLAREWERNGLVTIIEAKRATARKGS